MNNKINQADNLDRNIIRYASLLAYVCGPNNQLSVSDVHKWNREFPVLTAAPFVYPKMAPPLAGFIHPATSAFSIPLAG